MIRSHFHGYFFDYKADYNMAKINIWYLSSLLISLIVLIPIATVSFSFFEETSEYYKILKNTFLVIHINGGGPLIFNTMRFKIFLFIFFVI